MANATPPDSGSHTDDSSRWLFLGLIVLSSVSLVGTVSWSVQWMQTTATTTTETSLATPATNPTAVVAASRPAREVTLLLDDTTQTIQTPLENPQAILAAQQITLAPVDRVWLDGTLATREEMADWPVPVNEIEIRRQLTLTIRDGEQATTVQTSASTVGEALFEADIAVYMSDTVTPPLDTSLTGNIEVVIERAVPVTITVDSTQIKTRVQGATVGDALAESGVSLAGLDYTMPARSDPIEPQMTIAVMRITEDIDTYDEQIPFETQYQPDPDLQLDARQTIQNGQYGTRRYRERVRYENGVEIAREPEGSEVVQAPQTRIVAYGTNIILRDIQTPQGTRQYWRKLRVYATSYHPEALGGDDVTAIGETLRKGIVAADPTIIPYRTEVFVPNYGVGLMADTGGPRSSPYWIDLGYSDADWVGWSQYVDVYLLAPVPENINYRLPASSGMEGIPDS